MNEANRSEQHNTVPLQLIEAENSNTYTPRLLQRHGRIGRLRFVLYLFGAMVQVAMLCIWLLLSVLSIDSTIRNAVLLSMLAMCGALLLLYVMLLVRRRLHDINRSGWFVTLIVLPALNRYLARAAGH